MSGQSVSTGLPEMKNLAYGINCRFLPGTVVENLSKVFNSYFIQSIVSTSKNCQYLSGRRAMQILRCQFVYYHY